MNSSLLMNFAPNVLPILALIVGAVLALVRWRQHPGVSALVLLGCVLLLLNLTAGYAAFHWVIHLRNVRNWDHRQTEFSLGALNLGRVLVSTAAFACLLCAAFGWRRTRRDLAPFERAGGAPAMGIHEYGEINRGSQDIRKPLN